VSAKKYHYGRKGSHAQANVRKKEIVKLVKKYKEQGFHLCEARELVAQKVGLTSGTVQNYYEQAR